MKHRDFTNARSNAKRRGIEWAITFEQWSAVWAESGRYEQRGRRAGQYQMDRIKNDLGYAPGNVQVIEGRVNRTKDSPHGWRPKLTEEAVRDIRTRFKPRVVGWAVLAKQYGVSISAIKLVLTRNNWADVA